MLPEVSVVLPVYNAASTVVRAVRSILEQSLGNLELIVVDDGSTDGTREQLTSVSDPRLRVIEQAHSGVVVAANTGTEVARSAIVARMDGDDVSYSSRLEKELALLREGDFDAVGCGVRIVGADAKPASTLKRYETWINTETQAPRDLLGLRFVELPLVNPTILAKRRYFDLKFRDAGFPEDYDLLLRAANAGMRFAKVNEVLFEWHDGPGRLTRTHPRYSRRALDLCRREHLLQGPLAHTDNIDLWGLGSTGKPWLRWLQRTGIAVRRGYDINERKLGARIHRVLVSHPRQMPVADGTPLLIAVGSQGARDIIRPQLEEKGYCVGVDAWFVA